MSNSQRAAQSNGKVFRSSYVERKADAPETLGPNRPKPCCEEGDLTANDLKNTNSRRPSSDYSKKKATGVLRTLFDRQDLPVGAFPIVDYFLAILILTSFVAAGPFAA
jgi:hypothetical protein